jgi:hypothetical protein
MNINAFAHRETRRVSLDLLLAIVGGGIVFASLAIVTGGVLVPTVTIGAATTVVGLFYYFLWGKASLNATPHERGATAHDLKSNVSTSPIDAFTVVVNDNEQAALIGALERLLVEMPVNGNRPRGARETLREVLDRLRGYGA